MWTETNYEKKLKITPTQMELYEDMLDMFLWHHEDCEEENITSMGACAINGTINMITNPKAPKEGELEVVGGFGNYVNKMRKE